VPREPAVLDGVGHEGVVNSRSGDASILDQLLTAAEMADLLQMRVSTIEEYARRGLLPSVKLGRHRRFVRSQVEQAIFDMTKTRGRGVQ
jgi:excisionase family DNA binding protein